MVSVIDDPLRLFRDVDKAMRLGAGHVIGPIALADMVGLGKKLHEIIILYFFTFLIMLPFPNLVPNVIM